MRNLIVAGSMMGSKNYQPKELLFKSFAEEKHSMSMKLMSFISRRGASNQAVSVRSCSTNEVQGFFGERPQKLEIPLLSYEISLQ